MPRIGTLAPAALAASLTILSTSNGWAAPLTCFTVSDSGIAVNTPPAINPAATQHWAREQSVFGGLGPEVAKAYIDSTPEADSVQVCAYDPQSTDLNYPTEATLAGFDYFFGGTLATAEYLHSQFPSSSAPFLWGKSIPVLWGLTVGPGPFPETSNLLTAGDLLGNLPNPSAHSATITATNTAGLLALGLTLTTNNGTPDSPRGNYAELYFNNVAPPRSNATILGATIHDIVTGLRDPATGNAIAWAPGTVPPPIVNPGDAIIRYDAYLNWAIVAGLPVLNKAAFLSKNIVKFRGTLRTLPAGPEGTCTAAALCRGLGDGPYVEFPGFAQPLYAVRLSNSASALGFKNYFDESLANGSWNARLSAWEYATITAPTAAVPIPPYIPALTAAMLLVGGTS